MVTHTRSPSATTPPSDSPIQIDDGVARPGAIRETDPSKFATQTVRPDAPMPRGRRSIPIATVSRTPPCATSMRLTVAVFPLSTHTVPGVVAMPTG